MGSHGRGALAGALVGSVAQKVVHLSPVPVVLVK
jgi:nucleotide-binding universal stress UspA family protein